MKILFLIVSLPILFSCANQTSADKIENNSAQTTPKIANASNGNANSRTPAPNEPVDNAKLEELKKQNAVFEVVPEEFRKVKFDGFDYSSSREKKIIPLRNGSYQYEYKGGGCIACGGETYDLKSVYFLDLTGDGKKEAIVLLSVLSCGGSCDGGATFIYIYSANDSKPKLLWRLETGTLAYGCGVKSLAIEAKKIYIELFGRCLTENDEEKESRMTNKFSVIDTIRYLYEFNGKTFVRKHKKYISVPERNVMNYSSEISISE